LYNDGQNGGTSSPTLTNITSSNNGCDAMAAGCAMFNDGQSGGTSSPNLTNVTFSGNSAGLGGAMFNYGSTGTSNPTLTNVTFSGNYAAEGGAMYNEGSSGTSTPTLTNVIVWGNTSASGPDIQNDSAAPTIDHSVVQGGCPTGSTCTNLIATDPVLGALADNGGSTQTMLPGAGSSAIDAGTCTDAPTTDQRGIVRPQGTTCDIGAVEMRQRTLSVTVDGQGSVDAADTPAPLVGGIVDCTAAGGEACHASYSGEVAVADVVSIIPTPATGWHLDTWSDACAGGSVTLDGDKACTAHFAINQYTVTFKDWDGSVLATQTVSYGSGATAPPDPDRTGYTFTGWDAPFDNVTGDLVVTAQYTINRHTVGGMVGGLAGGSVVLSLNATQTQTVSTNGTFTFPDPLDYGTAYAVTVQTQPSGPAQVCTVAHGSGTLPDADVADVAVTCAPPQPNLSLSLDDGSDYARYGQVRDYVVTLSNSGGAAAANVAVNAEYGTAFDPAGTTWICTGEGGAQCAAMGSGPFADTATLPAGSRVTWTVSVPLLGDSSEGSATLRVTASGVPDAVDTDTLVIFRDGFDVAGADGTQALPSGDDRAILHGDGNAVVEVAPPVREGIETLRMLHDATTSVRVQRLALSNTIHVRLLTRDASGAEHATAWVPASVGARLVLGSVENGQSGRVLLLEGAARSLALPFNAGHD
jgi:hypothetical protein